MQRVRLQDLAVVHETPHLFGRGRQPLGGGADDDVHGLGGGQVMADRADPAQPLDEDRGLPVRPSLDEPLKTAELNNVKARLSDLAFIVQVDGDLAVAFDPCHGFDRDLSSHARSPFSHT